MTEKLSELEVIKEKIQSVKAEKIVLEEKSNKLAADLKVCKKDLKEWTWQNIIITFENVLELDMINCRRYE